MKNLPFLLMFILTFSVLNTGMAGRGVYDEEARAQERQEREMRKMQKEAGHPMRNMAGGVKQATVDSTAGFVSETAAGSKDGAIVGTLEGARKASGNLADNAIKGALKVATLGYGDVEHVTVEEPETGTDETTKWSIPIPGT